MPIKNARYRAIDVGRKGFHYLRLAYVGDDSDKLAESKLMEYKSSKSKNKTKRQKK